MSTLERAIAIAAEGHAGQFDKAGQPYILHPIRVMLRVSGASERIAAILHDVVEDTPVTLDQLSNEGFSREVVEAVDALTKRRGENRIDAAKRAAANPIARVVKLARQRGKHGPLANQQSHAERLRSFGRIQTSPRDLLSAS